MARGWRRQEGAGLTRRKKVAAAEVDDNEEELEEATGTAGRGRFWQRWKLRGEKSAVEQVDPEEDEDEDAWATMLAGQIRFLLDGMEVSGAPVTAGALDRLRDLQAEFGELEREKARIENELVAAINRWARERGIPHVATDS